MYAMSWEGRTPGLSALSGFDADEGILRHENKKSRRKALNKHLSMGGYTFSPLDMNRCHSTRKNEGGRRGIA